MTKLEYAQNFLKSKIAVIPLRHRGKEPESSMMGGTWEKYKTQLHTEYESLCWLGSGWQNYGVVMGWSGLAVIDFDNSEAFNMWLLNFTQYSCAMPYIVRTARGAHVYISLPAGGANEKRRGVDVKIHGYVVGPGCTHPSGAIYEPVTEFNLPEVLSLDTILPLDLFPRVAREAEAGTMAPVKIAQMDTEYDPYQMAMFSDHLDLISRVKQSVRIENMFSSALKSSPDGRWLKDWCRFHNDERPGGTMSFWIDTVRQICGCAVCLFKPMDVLNLYARMHNISDSDAVTALAKEIGVWG